MFDLWGTNIELANEMEANGVPAQINVSQVGANTTSEPDGV